MTGFDYLIVACGVLALLYGVYAARSVLAASSGNERMREIADAIQEGARAYLNRQYLTIGMVGIVMGVLLGWLLGVHVAVGYFIGSILSGAAGYIGMNVSVRANVRTADAARTGGMKPALDIAFKSGAVTGALRMPWRFPVPLLYSGLSDANPFAGNGITRYNPSAANSGVRNFTTGADMGAVASIVAGRNSLVIEVTGVGGGGGSGVGDDCGIHLLIFGEL